jgi:predicted outer membrane protein
MSDVFKVTILMIFSALLICQAVDSCVSYNRTRAFYEKMDADYDKMIKDTKQLVKQYDEMIQIEKDINKKQEEMLRRLGGDR